MQPAQEEKQFLGQPRGLSTLFFTEMWERFSYYGMRAILVFFLYAKVTDTNSGLGLPQAQAAAIMSIYGALVYMSSIVGGWVSDRLLGGSKAVFIGGIAIMLGHIALATPFGLAALFVSITFIVIGTGLLKPNVSNLVGLLYDKKDLRRDTGFSIYYMGINIGAFIAPLVVGTIGQKYSYHLGFGIAAIGMALALIVFYVERKKFFPNIAVTAPHPLNGEERKKFLITFVTSLVAIAIVFGGLALTGRLTIALFIDILSVVGILLPIFYFVKMLTSKTVSSSERQKVLAYIPLFISGIIFWSIEEQGSSIIALYAQNRMQHAVNLFGHNFHIEASWVQTLNPLFIILFTPIFVTLWSKLGERQPSTVVKFGLGLILTGLSYVVITLPAILWGTEQRVSPLWLVLLFAIMMAGELLVSPVGLSVTTKLAPNSFQSQTVAIWLLADAASQAINAQLAKFFSPATEIPYFGIIGLVSIAFGIVLFLIRKPIIKLMQEVR
jgi:POT family proton-dependent oligopeptide transporter